MLDLQTPKDKLQCVLRCSTTIMNLLSMANEKSVPAADDFMPVLIFVMIKANVPSLLSTVQYIKSFYEKRLNGEEQYWWMQFSSAIEFIKTMDYNEWILTFHYYSNMVSGQDIFNVWSNYDCSYQPGEWVSRITSMFELITIIIIIINSLY